MSSYPNCSYSFFMNFLFITLIKKNTCSLLQKKIGLAAKASLASKYGTNYTVGNPPEIICKNMFYVIYLGPSWVIVDRFGFQTLDIIFKAIILL